MKKKNLLFLIVIAFCGILNAQVGINTENPQGMFHIDGQGNTNGNTNISDDIVVTETGNVGIGTNTPSNKLSIHTTGANTGLSLPNGASSGKVLTSDTQGNGVWVSGAVQYQTMVVGTGGATIFSGLIPFPTTGSPIGVAAKINFFKDIVFDKAKDIYGATYGWNATNQEYVAPVTGIYRISMNMYFQSVKPGVNYRALARRNGSLFQNPGFISIVDNGLDQNSFVMGLVSLNQGDIISFEVRIYGGSVGKAGSTVSLFAGPGHTFILIESL